MILVYRILYSRHINKFIRNLLKLIPALPGKFKIPPSGILKINVDGRKFFLATNQTCYVTHLLFWNGYKSFEYTEFFVTLIGKVKTFYDVGANIGYYSLLGSTVNSQLKVYAFEPAMGPSHFLKRNILLNNKQETIQEFTLALSNDQSEVQFQEVRNKKYSHLLYNLSGENNLVEKRVNRDFIKRTVQTETIDRLVPKANFDIPDLIKIDTEGAEPLVLEGATATIKQTRPIVISEILHIDKAIWITSFFKKLEGYNILKLIKSKPEKIVTIDEEVLLQTHDFLFIPEEKTHLIS